LAELAGFLPLAGSPPTESRSQLAELAGIPIMIAHGIQDETVPIAMAREARKSLESSGVKVSYCESETGHKLGANCARQLADFFVI
jgi:predicted esterase